MLTAFEELMPVPTGMGTGGATTSPAMSPSLASEAPAGATSKQTSGGTGDMNAPGVVALAASVVSAILIAHYFCA
jgi:hypothetical protein